MRSWLGGTWRVWLLLVGGLCAAPAKPQAEPQTEAAALKKEARELAQRVVAEFPADATAHALLASVLYNLGDSATAVTCLTKCLELNPRMAEAYDVLATIASKKGEAERAVELCRQALRLNPRASTAHHRLGRALMDLGRPSELIAAMHQAIESCGPSSEAYYLLGQGYLQSKEHEKAKTSFRTVTEIFPGHTQAYFGLFTACARLGQRDEAARHQQTFRELEAQDRKALTTHNRQDSTLAGLSHVRQVVAKACTGGGQIYRKHNRFGRAEALWRRAADLDPGDMLCRAQLVALFRQQNRKSAAVKLFEQLITRQPEAAANCFFLGMLHAQARRHGAAEQALRKAIELGPQRPEGYRALARLFLTTGRDLRDARTLAARLVELQPSPPHLFLLAVACAKTGDPAGALKAVDRALRWDPENPEYLRLRKQLAQER